MRWPSWEHVDATEMKTLDDQAIAGSNTEDFLELRRQVRAKRAPLLMLANLVRRVLLGEDVARPLAELEKR